MTRPCDWRVSDLGWIYTLFFVFLGSAAALWGGWVERVGPRKAGVVSAVCWSGGIAIAAIGVFIHQLWIMWLGAGVIGGVECNHLAFRTNEVDWQIWIADGDRPYPCRYVITSKTVAGFPEYRLDVRNWKSGAEVAPVDFAFQAPPDAKKLELNKLPDTDELPDIYAMGPAK